MGMRQNPGCGYVVELDELLAILPDEQRAEFEKLEDGGADFESLLDYLSTHAPDGTPLPSELLLLGEDDTSGDLAIGTFYVRFDEADLFRREKTPALERLESLGLVPTPASWSLWG